jgi:Tol biopolymer transport system component
MGTSLRRAIWVTATALTSSAALHAQFLDKLHLAFTSDRTGRSQIWETETNLAGPLGVPTQLTAGGAGSQTSDQANWSVNGFVAYQFGASGVRGVHQIAASASPAGSGDVRITFSTGDERDCSWSQDGNFLVYARLPQGGSDYDIWIHDIAQNVEYPLLVRPNNLDLHPTWSPDGNTIAFVTTIAGRSQIAVQGVQVVHGIVQAVPGTFKVLTSTLLNAFSNGDPTWSPDSKAIAFWTTQNGNRDIYVMPSNTGDAGQLVQWTNGLADDLSARNEIN